MAGWPQRWEITGKAGPHQRSANRPATPLEAGRSGPDQSREAIRVDQRALQGDLWIQRSELALVGSSARSSRAPLNNLDLRSSMQPAVHIPVR